MIQYRTRKNSSVYKNTCTVPRKDVEWTTCEVARARYDHEIALFRDRLRTLDHFGQLHKALVQARI